MAKKSAKDRMKNEVNAGSMAEVNKPILIILEKMLRTLS